MKLADHKNIMDQQNPRLISRCYDLYKHFQQAIIFSLIIVFQLALAGSTHTYTGVTFISLQRQGSSKTFSSFD